MDFKQLFDSFAKRNKSTNRKDVKPLTYSFKSRTLMLCQERLGFGDSSIFGPDPDFWEKAHRRLRFLKGSGSLSGSLNVPLETDLLRFLDKCSDDEFLEFVETIFRVQKWWGNPERSMSISDINIFFDEDDLPYYLTDYTIDETPSEGWGGTVTTITSYPTVVYREDEVLHQMAIEPTLSILGQSRFENAHEEFLGGLKDYKKRRFKECVAKCASSLESVMKIICVEKGWNKKSASKDATALLSVILNNSSLESYYKNPLQIVPIIRNENSIVHGAGPQPRIVTKHVANFVINSTAATILLLVEEAGL